MTELMATAEQRERMSVLRVGGAIAISTPTGISSLVHLYIIPILISGKRHCWRLTARGCLWDTMIISHFNENMLHPCPVLDNPGRLTELADKSGAKSTDYKNLKIAKEFSDKCVEAAKNRGPVEEGKKSGGRNQNVQWDAKDAVAVQHGNMEVLCG